MMWNQVHLRGGVPSIGNYLSAKFEVSGLIEPDAGFEKVVRKTIMDSFSIWN